MQILDTSAIPASQPSLNVSTIPEKERSVILGTATISHGASVIPEEQGATWKICFSLNKT